jgi:predicted membrane chloride channel (bestrophin family)
MDQGRQGRAQVDAAVVPDVRGQRGAAPASALAYNLGNFLRTLATPEPIKDWSLTSLKEKLIKIGAKVVCHERYVAFQMAEVAIPRQMFQEILRFIAKLRPQPPPVPA